jgi:hypothetical protein
MEVESGQQQSHKNSTKEKHTKRGPLLLQAGGSLIMDDLHGQRGLLVKKDLPSRRHHGNTFQLAKKATQTTKCKDTYLHPRHQRLTKLEEVLT